MIADTIAAGILTLTLLPALTAATLVRAQQWRKRRQLRRPVTALPVPVSTPVEHQGATEDYADELAALRETPATDELRSTAEQMTVDHQELDGIGYALDEFGERVLHRLRLFLRNDPEEYLRVVRWGRDALAQTGQFDRAELEALLADDAVAGAR